MIEPINREVTVLNAALELPPAERPPFLDQACAGDAALRKQVEALLQSHEQADGFLETPPAGFDLRRAELAKLPLTEKPGDRIGRYKLLQQIGEGGCGVVYMAEQEEPVRRRVALKVIKLGMDTKSVVARFEAERQALALMDHPNIARVLDAGATEAGRPYFVLELVRGIKITEFCDENKLPTQDRLRLYIQVCLAIQHAHQKGIIHRDIKPSNILVTINDGVPVPKVIDFGIAKATAGRLTEHTLFTAFEQFIGTPAYVSPEQAVMTSLDVDTRSDIYSLGVLLYELLTGRTPFDAKELLATGLDEMRRTIRECDPPNPSTRLSRLVEAELTTTAQRRQTDAPKLIQLVRGDLDWIVMKCLEKDRTRRYETANGLAMDVQRHLNNEPVTARPPSNLYRLHKLVQRNRLAFAASATVAMTILLALAFLLVSNVRTTRERNQKEIALQEKAAALDAANASEQRAKEELFASLRSQAQARRYSRRMGQRQDSLAALSEAARLRPDPGLRDEAIAAMALPDLRRGPKWQVLRTNCLVLACDAMGQRYAVLDHQGGVTVRRIEDDQELHRFETGPVFADRYTSLAFSPDGRYLAKVGDDKPPLLWSLDGGETILQAAPVGASAPTFSADKRFVALAGVRDVDCFDLATGRESNRWRTAGRLQTLQFHPTNGWLAVGYKDTPWVSLYDAASGREIAQLDIGSSYHTVVSWHPDGRHLAVGGAASGIQVWDVEARRRVALLEGHAREVDFLTYHPSGRWLVSWGWDEVIRLWEPTTGRQAMQIPLRGNLQFSRDGRWLGFFWFGKDEVQLLEFVSPLEYVTLQGNSKASRVAHTASAVSADDRLLAVAMDDGVRLWDLAGRREVALVPSGETAAVVFESDGQALWTCARDGGLQRWPIRPTGTNLSELQIGPPHPVELPFAPRRISLDRADRALAVVSETAGQTLILDLATQSTRILSVPHPMVSHVAVSPDAKWLATSGWHTDRVQLWNLERAELVRDWVVGMQTKVAFTPDSQELILARASEFQFVKVEALETSRQLAREIGLYPSNVAFSSDGKLMAMEMAPAVIHFMEAASGRTLAQLEDPFGDRSDAIFFSRDGTKLIVVSSYAAAIHVWDLRAIRAGLKPMGLDWDWPEFPSVSAFEGNRASPARAPLQLQVIGAATQ